jgi:phytoene dehydrogenase-like protein
MAVVADVVVAGAGHNSLITAAYLAMSGRSVVMVDARPVAGGGAVTEELLLPGYQIDSCSTGHTLLLGNPVIAADELGLLSEQGLTYIAPDPVAHLCFPDGEHFTMWLDVERTTAEFARFSQDDAKSYRRMLEEWETVRHAFAQATYNPVGLGPSLDDLLRQTPHGNVWLRRKALSAWDVVKQEFKSPHVRAFVMWQAFQTLVSLDQPGSGSLAYSILAGRQKRSWSMPRGGSGQLTEALIRKIESHGGTIITGKKVRQLVINDGRCSGFVTDDGEQYLGREAVVSTIHVKHLIEMAPKSLWDEAFRYGVETFDVGIPAFVVYLCTTEPPRFKTATGTASAVSAGITGWSEDIIRLIRQIRDGEVMSDAPWVLVATPTLADDTRAPAGHHTVKLIVPCSLRSPSTTGGWDDAKESFAQMVLKRVRDVAPNLTPDVITAMLIRSPNDIEAANPHMINGTFHGGDRSFAFSGSLRPAPGWAQHRTPIPGLYQTGGTTHPGGSITGAPGRNAACIILKDLGTSIEEVVAAHKATAENRLPQKV